tara:strand:+ start:138 stop:464 length:327 start_codon:yes stop_codon:yes gene_type:complete
MEKEKGSSDTQDVSKKSGKRISGDKFFEEFNKLFSHEEEYTLDELKKHLSVAYKQAGKKVTVKREPSAYNKFMKEELPKLRKENPDTEIKNLMGLVGEKWKANKQASQ